MSNPETSGQSSRLAAPEPAYKRTLEELRAQRRVPVIERHLTIGGGIEQSVHAAEDRKREVRIGTMENRLREIRGHAENEFAVSQQKACASRDFERER